VRLAVALAGVGFAVVLMLMQVGFEDALFQSAVNVHERLKGDIVLISPRYNAIAFPTTFPRRRLYQTLSFDGVVSVSAVYTSLGRWKNPATGKTRQIFTIGLDPAKEVLDVPELAERRALIRYPDVVLYDELSRPEFGPIAAMVASGQEVATEVSDRRITVKGLLRLGTSFGVDGTIVTSDVNFMRIFPGRTPAAISIGLVQLEPGADTGAVREALAAALPRDVEVLTKPQFMQREIDYWDAATPIGFVFKFGVIMGLVVGGIIVYQILYADVADHLGEYATLKAIGYMDRYLAAVVLTEALTLAVLGYVPGLAACWWLYGVTAAATNLPMQIAPGRGLVVLGLTIAMCGVSGLIALRKLRAADPAEIF